MACETLTIFDAAAMPEDSVFTRLPNLLWASLGVFLANVAVLAGILMVPELKIMSGSQSEYRSSDTKPSPFAETAASTRVRKAKAAVRMQPVLLEMIELPPAASDAPSTVSGAPVPLR